MEGEAAADPCAICLGDVGRGQAIFTADVAYGHRDCPLCKATWRDLPAVGGPVVPRPPRPARPSSSHGLAVFSHGPYDDDEPVVEQSVEAVQDEARAADHAVVALRTHCERPAVAGGASRVSFAVLVHAVAPGAAAAGAQRAPLDLVTVIDLSGSMRGQKLYLVKQAVGFVIGNLGPADRLSVVSFSNDATSVVQLARMTADGKASAKRAVEALVASGGTNIGEGLRVAARVLDDRRYGNAVTSMILLSDGRDGYVRCRHADLVPPSRPSTRTFGFGTDHDAAAMHTVAEETGGTFSFVENQAAIRASVRIAVACVHPGVRVLGVKSGRYENRVDADRRAASVDVGELYADEERRFLVFVRVPTTGATEEVTQLIKVRCSYRTPPPEVPDGDAELSMEVERERVRVTATEDIAAARAAAERGENAEAARILEGGQEAVRRSAPGMAGDPTCAALEDELGDLGARAANRMEYEQTGRAAMLAGMSSHRQQRALSVAVRPAQFGLRVRGRGARRRYGGPRRRSAPRPYVTPAMQNMLKISRSARGQQQRTSSPAPPGKRMRLRFAE
ncbi:hypothetical protein GQ55_9G222100 [Panicum hallii var. hallii]|uniref:VWFA domain-containing protein n=1 Tax=Panicum hallii var. hallii TaxID=1504633 RepID=A0A2T7C607_9POAL|nr:hypothetical protein GQ55_9G222100 [Panicum hallii var. hallii]